MVTYDYDNYPFGRKVMTDGYLVVLVITAGVLITAYLIFKGLRDARRIGDV